MREKLCSSFHSYALSTWHTVDAYLMKVPACCPAPSVGSKVFSLLPTKGPWEESEQLIHTKV